MTETDVRNEAVDEAETDRLARKILKGIGIALWVTAVIIAVINILMRFDMAEKIEDYTIVKGKVTEVNTRREKSVSRRSSYNTVFYTHIEFKYDDVHGREHSREFIEMSRNDNIYDVGDTARVAYDDDPNDAFAIKKDRLCGGYLPVSKNYNAPLIVAAVLIAIGLYFFFDDSISHSKLRVLLRNDLW